MIIFENGTWQTNSEYPASNYLENLDCNQPKWVVPDASELAGKIMSTSYWEPIIDDDGNLIDITSTEAAATVETQIIDLKSQLTTIDQQAIRPLRAIIAGTATDEDRTKLTELELQAEKLREQLNVLAAE